MVQVVIEVGPCADEEVHQAAVHQLDQAAAQSSRRQRAGQRETDRGVVGWIEHLLREDMAGFREPSGVECLESPVDELAHVGTAPWPVVANRFAAQVILVRMGR